MTNYVTCQPECGPETAVSANWVPTDTVEQKSSADYTPKTTDRSKNRKTGFILVNDSALFPGR